MELASLVVLVLLMEKLIERFGDEYRAYTKRTGRLLAHIERDQTGTAIPGRTRPRRLRRRNLLVFLLFEDGHRGSPEDQDLTPLGEVYDLHVPG